MEDLDGCSIDMTKEKSPPDLEDLLIPQGEEEDENG